MKHLLKTRPSPGGRPFRTPRLPWVGSAVLPSCLLALTLVAQDLLVPMDETQRDHLKAYGLTTQCVKAGLPASWLLNVRGGAFLLTASESVVAWAGANGVTVQRLGPQALANLRADLANANAAEIKLEKFPRIAVYTPPQQGPWADAVTLVLQYAGIPYDTLYDKEVLAGDLSKYDWLHLHHEDFTGQHGKFWATYRFAPWYLDRVAAAETEARALGFPSVPKVKAAVARRMQGAVQDGLFLFAMCAATETLDIALAAQDTDIVPSEIDGSPVAPDFATRLRYEASFAFTGFTTSTVAHESRFSDIDFNQVNTPNRREVTDFTLFEFSAKLDPVPTLLNQCHQTRLAGFFGQTSTFNKALIKDGVTILAESVDGSVRYLHGNFGKGAFTYYGGHAPEDRSHYVGDRPPEMLLHRNSPGFRLILNNVLFPSAKPPKKKT